MTKKKNPLILAIDTSCDDTSVAVLRGRQVLSTIISSQIDLHKKWGGVVPSIARRAHQENLPKAYQEALKRARCSEDEIDYIAVTYGPGLAIALEVGLKFAQDLAIEKKKRLVPINHMEGHLLASLALNRDGQGLILSKGIFPALALLISGNHSEIVYVKDIGDYQILGETLDDAAGEAFDKVARMLNLGYPGGEILSSLARQASPNWDKKEKSAKGLGRLGLPIPMQHSADLNFSFSGLKTACLYKIKELRESGIKETDWSYDLAREFIEVLSASLIGKLKKALNSHGEVKSIILGGGVSNNSFITRKISKLAKKENKKYLLPEKRFRSDNAAMIGVAAYYQIKLGNHYLESEEDISKLDRQPNLRLDDLAMKP